MKYAVVVLAAMIWLSACVRVIAADRGDCPQLYVPTLLDAHLAQAVALKPSAGTANAAVATASPVGQTQADVAAAQKALTDLQAVREAAQAAWESRNGWLNLLPLVSPAELAQAQGWSQDAAAAKQMLQEAPTLRNLLLLTAVRNQNVAGAYQNWRAAINRFDQADYLQDVVSQYRSFTREIDTEVGPQQHKEDTDLTFASPSVLALKGQLVDQDVAIARQQYLQALRGALMETAKEYFETQYHMRTVEIRKSNRVLVVQMQDSAQAQLQAGRVSQADVLKTQVMLEMIDNQIVQEADHIVPHHLALINALVNLPPDTKWGALVRVDLPMTVANPKELMAAAGETNQDLKQAEIELAQSQTMLRMAETMVLPRAAQGYSRIKPNEGAEAGPTRNDETTFPEQPMAGMPTGEFSANLAYLNELRVRVVQARARRDSLLQSVPAEVLVKHHYVHLAVKTAGTLDTVLPQSKQAFDLVKANYTSGNAPLVEFLDAGRAYFENALMQEEARMDLNERWADLQSAVGSSVAPLLTQPQAKTEGHGHD